MPRKAFQGQKFLPVPCTAGPESLWLDLLASSATSTLATTALLFLKRGWCWGIFNKGSGPGGLRVRSGYGRYSRGGSSLKCRGNPWAAAAGVIAGLEVGGHGLSGYQKCSISFASETVVCPTPEKFVIRLNPAQDVSLLSTGLR